MPTFGTSPLPAEPGNAAPPGRDRLGTVLTAVWAALHLPALALTGLLVHHQVEARSEVAAASAPDLLIE
ncbi:hypothetical protein [Kitasatospora aureofaciens]|uniref:hypothetical protein n=1 Tax=Kitasatospora aureofaciens TaxID=1894 RepID=UPI0033F90310